MPLNWLRQRIAFRSRREGSAGPPDPSYAYRVFWLKEARGWDPERRREVHLAVARLVAHQGFEPNEYRRRYRIEGLDDSPHAGASLIALLEVLAALETDAP